MRLMSVCTYIHMSLESQLRSRLGFSQNGFDLGGCHNISLDPQFPAHKEPLSIGVS